MLYHWSHLDVPTIFHCALLTQKLHNALPPTQFVYHYNMYFHNVPYNSVVEITAVVSVVV